MKITVELPNSFWVTSYQDHKDTRAAYEKIIAAAIDTRAEVSLKQHAQSRAEGRGDSANGVFYAYHEAHPGANTYCVRAAALPGLWYFDAGGYSGWSTLANDMELQEQSAGYDLKKADAAIAGLRKRFLDENISRLAQSDQPLESAIAALDGFLFYPLQVNSDEVLKLGPLGQFEVIEALSNLSREHQRHVVIKRHPLCDSEVIERILLDLKDHPFLHVSNASVHGLIASARAVLVSNSGVGLEALVHGTPVFSLARSEYAHMTTRLSSLDDLKIALLAEPAEQDERLRRQLGYLINEYWVDITSEPAIRKRINRHLEDFQASEAAGRTLAEAADASSLLHRAQKELVDIIDLILLGYPKLNERAKEKVAPLLARSANRGIHADRIFRATDAPVWRRSMNVLRARGDLATAEDLAQKILAETPQDSEALLLMSRSLAAKGERAESLKAAQAAVDAPQPTADALVYYGRQILTDDKNNSARALALAGRALKVKPDYAPAHFLRAKAYMAEEKVAQAVKSSTTAFRMAPENKTISDFHKQVLKRAKAAKSAPQPAAPETPEVPDSDPSPQPH